MEGCVDMKKQVCMKKSGGRLHDIQPVVSKLVNNGKVGEDNTLTYAGFEPSNLIVLLSQMITIGNAESLFDKEKIIPRVIVECISNERDDVDFFLSTMESVVREMQSIKEKEFYVLTGISLDVRSCLKKEWVINDCKITLSEGFDSMFDSRKEALESLSWCGSDDAYTSVVITVKSKTPKGAMFKGLRALNVFRALLCFDANNVQFIFGDNCWPINKVRLGRYQTVHKSSGEIVRSVLFHEKRFKLESSLPYFDESKSKVINNNIEHHLSSISDCKYSSLIGSALERCADALDEYDCDVAVVKLWGALESLVAYGDSNCERVPVRVAAVFGNDVFIKEWLYHIKDYRNRYVHEGECDQRSVHLAYKLGAVFKWVFIFFLRLKRDDVRGVLGLLDLSSKGLGHIELKESELRDARNLLVGKGG
ncbi:hypothetical protein CL635_03285 [bacterium]|nr:hypothetical protein [bacterium]